MSLWTWRAKDLGDLEQSVARATELVPGHRMVPGCFMWDYGDKQPMPLDAVERQCALGLRWLQEGIAGMIALAGCITDLGLETLEWCRRWIAEVGDHPLPAEDAG